MADVITHSLLPHFKTINFMRNMRRKMENFNFQEPCPEWLPSNMNPGGYVEPNQVIATIFFIRDMYVHQYEA